MKVDGCFAHPASPNQASATTPRCDGEKMKEKDPTAEKGEPAKRQTEKAGKSTDDKSAPKQDAKESDKS